MQGVTESQRLHLMDRKVEVVSDQVPLMAMALLVGMFGICTEHSTAFKSRQSEHKP